MKRAVLFLLFLSVFFLNETFNVSEKFRAFFYRMSYPFLKLRESAVGIALRLKNEIYPGDVYVGLESVGNLFFVTGRGEDCFYILGEVREGTLVIDPMEKRFLGVVVAKGPLSKVETVFSDNFVGRVRIKGPSASVVGILRGGSVPKVSTIEDIDVTGWKVFFEDEKWNVILKDYLFVGSIAGRDGEYFLLDAERKLPDRVAIIGVVE
ncbi:hypothetical protein [Thermotoga sp. KOL6]|uniref:hypothetical protein n=1 Tax=Thermotoga sp. KOL6 TaxID=126741 RepID=UPI000C76D01E|nr:hypothetical protein [Thermotoga sp. KOL6]PLV59302.1 hypothetical protein AS005_06070 [Thermotoga sp. KOL6]